MIKKHIILDSYLITNVFESDVADEYIKKLTEEVKFGKMMVKGGVVPREICLQITKSNGIPIYRHPVDQHPPLYDCTPTIDIIRHELENIADLSINHILIQRYNHGKEFISEHADKTLDIKKETNIINMSFGATRTMILRPKKDTRTGKEGETLRIDVPHNSIFILGWNTNKRYLHSIRKDNREDKFKTKDELAYGGKRISLTCRDIATYYDPKTKKLTGQGARKEKTDLTQEQEKELLYHAFHHENSVTDFDWKETYENGFDVLNFTLP